MSAEATGLVWKWSPYRGAPFICHLAIADVVNDAHGNEFWMSVPNLAQKARVDRRTAFRALAHMVAHGYLARLESGQSEGKPSRYQFLVDKFPGGVTSRHGGVTSTDEKAWPGVTQNSTSNSKERGGFSTGSEVQRFNDDPATRQPSARFRGELEPWNERKPACPTCAGTGWLEVEKGTVVVCDCVTSKSAGAGGGAS